TTPVLVDSSERTHPRDEAEPSSFLRFSSQSSIEGFSTSWNHGETSASTEASSHLGRTHGGFPICRSKPPRAKTCAKVSSQWKKPWSSATSVATSSHGNRSASRC